MRAARQVEGALAAALLVYVAGLCLVPMTESDLFFRLKVGQEILARRHLLERNLFSFTYPEHPDLDLAWGFEVMVALLHRAGGFPAVVLGKTAIVMAAFAGAYAVARRRGAGPAATTLALAAAALVMRERFVERPHVVSFLGEVGVLWVLESAGGRRRAGGLGRPPAGPPRIRSGGEGSGGEGSWGGGGVAWRAVSPAGEARLRSAGGAEGERRTEVSGGGAFG